METWSSVRRCTRAALLTSIVALLGVSACSSAPPGSGPSSLGAVLPVGPSSNAPTAAEATGTSSPASVTPAPLPAAARERTRKGAEAFVRHFLGEYNRAVTIPATGLLPPLSSPTCGTCDALESHARWLTNHESRFGAEPVNDRLVNGVGSRANPELVLSDPVYFVEALPQQRRTAITDSAGRTVKWVPGASGRMEFELRWVSRKWQVAKIRVVRES